MTNSFGNNRPRLKPMHHHWADQTHHTWNHKEKNIRKILSTDWLSFVFYWSWSSDWECYWWHYSSVGHTVGQVKISINCCTAGRYRVCHWWRRRRWWRSWWRRWWWCPVRRKRCGYITSAAAPKCHQSPQGGNIAWWQRWQWVFTSTRCSSPW